VLGIGYPDPYLKARPDGYLSEMGLLGQVPKFLAGIWVYLSGI
jgi:hypothetical protein